MDLRSWNYDRRCNSRAYFMNCIINEKNIHRCLIALKEHFKNQQVDDIAHVDFPKSICYGSEEWLIYMFYSCLLDYGMRSKMYHNNLIQTYESYPDIFNPKYVQEYYSQKEFELFEIIKNNVHPRYPNVALKKWITLSKELSKYDSLLTKIKSFTSFNEIERFIQGINGYGQKTGGLLLRLIYESHICNLNDNVSHIPLDRHDIEISYLNGIIERKNLSAKQIEALSTAYINEGNKLGLAPNVVDKYLWQIGNQFCNHKDCMNCPLSSTCLTK